LFILQPSSGVPLYRQIVEQVRRMIAGGQLAPGSELPSVRDVAQAHTVNPMTVSKAYAQLELEGLLERHRGRPMTVAAGRRAQSSVAQRLKQLEPQVDQLVLAARQLEIGTKELQALIERTWERNDE
jgi:GntR family transcriptional regulator